MIKQTFKTIILVLCIFYAKPVVAKYILFQVNMKGQTVNVNGVHIVGDFQTAAGFGSDWSPGAILLEKSKLDTNIYSVLLNFPANKKYEFKYVNGDQSYEVEIVPEESRVLYDFNDNRWFYFDSLNNDTTKMDAILFGGNAPENEYLYRLRVDMRVTAPKATGVHVMSNPNAFSPKANKMYSFDGKLYEIIYHAKDTTMQFRYVNGDVSADAERTIGGCTQNFIRKIITKKDSVSIAYCYESCGACATGNRKISELKQTLLCFPNPSKNSIRISCSIGYIGTLKVVNFQGKVVATLIGNGNFTCLSKITTGIGIFTVYSADHHFKPIRILFN